MKNIDLSSTILNELPKNLPKKVSGFFDCSSNILTTLKGSPQKIGLFFSCSNNNLTSLKYVPIEVGGDFFCSDNKLTISEIIKSLWNSKIKGKIFTGFKFNFKKFFKLSNRKKIKMLFEEYNG
jgi:hypothetical protein